MVVFVGTFVGVRVGVRVVVFVGTFVGTLVGGVLVGTAVGEVVGSAAVGVLVGACVGGVSTAIVRVSSYLQAPAHPRHSIYVSGGWGRLGISWCGSGVAPVQLYAPLRVPLHHKRGDRH